MKQRFGVAGVVVLVGASVLGVGCGAPKPEEQGATQSKLGFDGRTVFKGLYFQEGPAAAVIQNWSLRRTKPSTPKVAPTPAVAAGALRNMAKHLRTKNLTTTAKNLETMAGAVASTQGAIDPNAKVAQKRRLAMINLVLDGIAKKDPTFFQRFADDVQSGKHPKVQSALKEANVRLLAAVGTIGAKAALRKKGGSFHTGAFHDGEGDVGGDPGGGGDFGGDTSGDFSGDYGDPGSDPSAGDPAGGDPNADPNGSGDPSGDMQSASLGSSVQMNMYVWYDTAIVVMNVGAAFNTVAFSSNDDGNLQTASFVDHVTNGLAK